MKLYEAFQERGYHTTISTTFCIDFTAYEHIALERLRAAGCGNNLVIADSRMATTALDDVHRPPLWSGRRYSLVGADAAGLFHPKLTLQLGADRARLIVASANLTASGLAGNLEVAAQVRMVAEDRAHVSLMRQAFAFVEAFVPALDVAARRQLQWARDHTPWLDTAQAQEPADAPVQLLTTDSDSAIGRQFSSLLHGTPVSRLVVLSPYWDEHLQALRSLQEALQPVETAVVLQPGLGFFPDPKAAGVHLFDATSLCSPRERFVHAKIYVAQTADADHVLFGSPNCTVAALASSRNARGNVEAALYRRLPAGSALAALGLERALDGGRLEPSRLAPYQRAPDIPLEDAARRHPGRFNLQGRDLSWSPTGGFDQVDAVVEVLDSSQEVLQSFVPSGTGTRTMRLDGEKAPCFARVTAAAATSALAVIHIEDALLENVRIGRSRRLQEGLARLQDVDDDGMIVLYDAFALIQDEEERRAGTRRNRPSGIEEAARPTLTYEEFMRARTDAPAHDLMPTSSLHGSYTNEVRTQLNVLVGLEQARLRVEEVDDQLSQMPTSLADETPDGQRAIEEGAQFEEPVGTRSPQQDPAADLAASDQRTPRNSNAAEVEGLITQAVATFTKNLAETVGNRRLNTRDLLRARLLLTIILAYGTDKNFRTRQGPSQPVLLATGDCGWPRLVSNVLFRLFASHNGQPCLFLGVDLRATSADGLPQDVLECIGTCLWAVGALTLGRDARGLPLEVAASADRRMQDLYVVASGLRRAELTSGLLLATMDALGKRYASRLRVPHEEVMLQHSRMAALITTPASQ